MAYVDAFVVPVPRDRIEDYKAFTRSMLPFWMENGCLAYTECLADDAAPGQRTSFPRSVEAREDEVVALGWAVWPDKAARDAAGAKMREWLEPEALLPFDGGRMFWGGFQPFVEWTA